MRHVHTLQLFFFQGEETLDKMAFINVPAAKDAIVSDFCLSLLLMLCGNTTSKVMS